LNILLTGGTGFIGSHLVDRLENEGHDISIVSRRPASIKDTHRLVDLDSIPSSTTYFDVVINLAGEPIANGRWNTRKKKLLVASRVNTTQKLIDYISQLDIKPSLLISGSAIGFYGLHASDESIDETAQGDASFSAQLCAQWEQTALQAETLNIRTCLLRTGIVLGKNNGALKRMLPPFKFGLGGTIGSGQQWMPWIHIDDILGIIMQCIDDASLNGPINAVAPNPVTNQAFTKALGKALNRPTLLPMPATIVKLLFGQMGEELLLSGRRVIPGKALEHGYTYHFDNVEQALENCLR